MVLKSKPVGEGKGVEAKHQINKEPQYVKLHLSMSLHLILEFNLNVFLLSFFRREGPGPSCFDTPTWKDVMHFLQPPTKTIAG